MISVQDAWAQDDVAEQARGVQADLGWGLHPAHNGRGYATEAVGTRREAYTVRDFLHRSGAWLDGTAYALLQEEWRARE